MVIETFIIQEASGSRAELDRSTAFQKPHFAFAFQIFAMAQDKIINAVTEVCEELFTPDVHHK